MNYAFTFVLASYAAPARRLLAAPVAFLLCALAGAPAAHAQSTNATQVDPPIVAVHYQDLLAGEPALIDLFVPPPLLEWDEFAFSADECLQGRGVHEGPPDKVLIVRFEVPDEGTCTTRVDLLFTNGDSSWAAAALVVVNRLPDLAPLEGVAPWFQTGRINLPSAKPDDPPAVLLLMGLTNSHHEPLSLLGFGNDAGFVRAVGQVFRYDPATFHGRYEDLVRNGSPFEPTLLQPGATAHFAMVLDPQQRMPTGAGTLTARPVALIERAGERHTVQFPRMSTAWGVELP
ncbi:MAG: hypothetical protein WDA15_03105 [Trueperaceae bacterium]